MEEHVDTFLAITDSADRSVALHFLEMAAGSVETAIALFFEHGGALMGGNGHANAGAIEDAEMAQRLQLEAYSNDAVREVDSNAHYHDTLVDDGFGPMFPQMTPSRAMFGGNTNRGVFNQIEELSDEDMSEGYSDSDGVETVGDRERREHRQKLAHMFRPPFDIISRMTLDQAKTLGRQTKQWVLVNIQDNADFRCQVLNRDLWSRSAVKELVREHFIFLQYAADAPIAADYTQFYPFTDYPHIAVLDPMTGERLKLWSEVPEGRAWCDEVEDFLDSFSVGKASNPTVVHTKKINPSELTEEQQLEFAMRQSMGDSGPVDGVAVTQPETGLVVELELEVEEVPAEVVLAPEEQAFNAIPAVAHAEPVDPATTTRIQIRTGDGKRTVRRFGVDDQVRVIYEVIKATFADGSRPFVLTSQRLNLITVLDQTVAEAGLKNASVLMESS